MLGGYGRWVAVSILLLLGLFRLPAPSAGPRPPLDEEPAEVAAPSDVAVPVSPAVAAPDVVTTTVHVPLILLDADAQYLNPYGIVTYDGVGDTWGLAQMDAAGAKWVTTVLHWQGVEPNPPVGGVHTYNWNWFDLQASNAQAAGVDLFVLISHNPTWAAAHPGGPVNNPADLTSFVTALAERYDGDGFEDAVGSPVVNYWSFYGEPDYHSNDRPNKGTWGHNPQGYAAMLAQVAPAMHAANPNAKVVNGGVAYDWFTHEGGIYVKSFLPGVLQSLNSYPGGVTHYLDAVAFHYYPISLARWPTIREKALEIQGIMNTHGAGGLPMLVPETGYWSEGTASGETKQARTLVQLYVRSLSVRIRMVSWFSVFDHGGGTEEHGLFRGTNLASPKPAYTAYDVLTTELPWFSYVGPFTAAGVEGYTFRVAGGKYKTVLWATGSARNVAFSQECARRVDMLGAEALVTDGGAGDLDGANNGQVTLSIGSNPTYVGACPP